MANSPAVVGRQVESGRELVHELTGPTPSMTSEGSTSGPVLTHPILHGDRPQPSRQPFPVDKGPMRAQTGKFTFAGDGLSFGYDSGDSVSLQYRTPGAFTGGTIENVTIDTGKESFADLHKEAAAALERN